jgi:hypothetical protein
MKLLGTVLFLSLCATFYARADLTIMQKVDGPGQSGELTIKIKGEKERIDSADQPTRIIDGKTGEMTNLLNDKKTFLRISADQMKAMAQTLTKYGNNQPAEKPKLSPTGKKETVNGYEVEEYVYETPQFKATFWVAPKYPDAASILKQMQLPISQAWKPSTLGMPDYTDFPGMPLKTIVSMGGTEVTTTISSVKEGPISDSEFAVPKDYKEIQPPIKPAPSSSP